MIPRHNRLRTRNENDGLRFVDDHRRAHELLADLQSFELVHGRVNPASLDLLRLLGTVQVVEFPLKLDSKYTEWRESILLSGVGRRSSVLSS
jgi:hypothetical protein